MTPDNTPQVPGGPAQPGVAAPAATPQAVSPVTAKPVTPANPPVDAAALMAQFQTEKTKLEKDISGLKSASQRREYELQQQLQQQQREAQEQIDRARTAGMDDEQRKIYEAERANEKLQEIQEQLQQTQTEKSQMEGKFNAYQFFLNAGIPANKLDLTQSLEDLVQGGYTYLAERNAQLEAMLAGKAQSPAAPPAAPAAPAPLPTAPVVDLGAGGTPGTGPNWADIDREYATKGGRERFYQDLQQGIIPYSRLPMTQEK